MAGLSSRGIVRVSGFLKENLNGWGQPLELLGAGKCLCGLPEKALL